MSARIPLPGPAYSQPDMAYAMQLIEQRLASLEGAIAEGYVVTNGATVRTLDVSTATVSDVAAFIGTLIADMKQRGILA